MLYSYVDPASIYQILPQIRPDPDPNRIQIHWIRQDPDPPNSHHRISGRIRCIPNLGLTVAFHS